VLERPGTRALGAWESAGNAHKIELHRELWTFYRCVGRYFDLFCSHQSVADLRLYRRPVMTHLLLHAGGTSSAAACGILHLHDIG